MYKVWILATGEIAYATNGLDFDTIEKAKDYAVDLLYRWMGAERYAVLPKIAPSGDPFGGFLSPEIITANSVN